MSGISTASDTESLDTLRSRWRFGLARLKSDPNGASYVADFVAFGPKWDTTDQKERDYQDAVSDAEAAAFIADVALDTLVDKVAYAIHGGKKVNVSLPLHQLYFGNDAPSAFKRPILGAELTRMEAWPAKLASASQPGLVALAAPVTAAIKAADAAAKTLAGALADRDTFKLSGERKKIFDAYNALCATAYGGLKTFVHNHPELGLPIGYAESFFLRVTSVSQPKTVGAASDLVAKLEQKLEKAKTAHANLLAKQTAHAQALAIHAKALADAAAAKKAELAAKKAVIAAKAEAKKKKPKKG